MARPKTRSSVKRLYAFITEDEQGDVCADLPEEACSAAPNNFFLNALNGAFTKLGDQLGSPDLVLPWLLDTLGAPASITGFLSPVRNAGALLPQLAVSGRIREFAFRKGFWLGGGFFFGLAYLLMVPAALTLTGAAAGLVILALLAFGSLSRGVSSVAFKDVLAKTIPQGRRGTLLAIRATVGGLLALGAGLILRTKFQASGDIRTVVFLVGSAGVLWLLGAAVIFFISEEPGATEGAQNALEEARAGLALLRKESGFRRYILARAFLLSIELSLPYYALYARRFSDGSTGDLGVFIIAASLAQVISSPVWGRLSDRTSRWVMVSSGILAALTGVYTLLLSWLSSNGINIYLLGIAVTIIGFARAGVRLGRQTYLIDGAPEIERPLYFASSNTIIGVITLAGGGLGFIAQEAGIRILLAILILLALSGAAVSFSMPEAKHLASR
ncbi:MAG: MFS transporter [Anaerolineales bacterium]|nr:MFS transporter [Anaerolineales bacterium]